MPAGAAGESRPGPSVLELRTVLRRK